MFTPFIRNDEELQEEYFWWHYMESLHEDDFG